MALRDFSSASTKSTFPGIQYPSGQGDNRQILYPASRDISLIPQVVSRKSAAAFNYSEKWSIKDIVE
jgi:hypothetical protein